MSFKDAFQNRHVVLPVIHAENESQALANIEVALQEAADGVFLINHAIPSSALLQIHSAARKQFPDAWIGLNCLDLAPDEVFSRICPQVNGVWSDNAMIDESSDRQPQAQHVLEVRREFSRGALYFGGVAFKYQAHVHDLAIAARKAARFMDVVTTSGPGTGQAAHIGKIRVMKQALGSFPLAIASGITPDNIDEYLPYSDCYLVATGISTSFTQLNASLLHSLIGRVRSYSDCLVEGPIQLRQSKCLSVCFVCEWNEGRSPHLELSVRKQARDAGCVVRTCSAGLRQGGRINALRRDYLTQCGIPSAEVDSHRSTLFDETHTDCDLVLVAETRMKERLLDRWPSLNGRIMTIRAFALGQTPDDETLTPDNAHITDAGGHDYETKLMLYAELEELARMIVARLCG